MDAADEVRAWPDGARPSQLIHVFDGRRSQQRYMKIPDYAAAQYPDLSTHFEEFYGALVARKRAALRPEDVSPVALIPFKIELLLQVGIRRVLELADGFVREADARSWTPLFVISRAMLETSALVYDVWTKGRDALASGDQRSLEEYDKRLAAALMGAKVEEWGGPGLKSINIVTVIQRVTKTIPALLPFYEGLSEQAHPNYMGMYGLYHRVAPSGDKGYFVDAPMKEDPRAIAGPLSAAACGLGLLLEAANSYDAAVGALCSFCEAAIHQDGTWPAHIPYPVPRPVA